MQLKLTVIIFLILIPSFLMAKGLKECEDENFKTCVLGITWGTELPQYAVSNLVCPKLNKVADWGRGNCEKLGSTQESRLANHCTEDWCELAKEKRSSVVCSKKGTKYCYLGVNNSFESNPPHLMAILYALGWIEGKDMVEEGTKDEDFGLEVLPVEYDEEAADGFKARYLATWHDRMFGFLSESVVPEKIDPKYFSIKAEQKYGKPVRRIIEQQPILNIYSEITFWGDISKRGEQLQIMLVAAKTYNSKARIYSGKLDIDTLLMVKGMLEEQANKKVQEAKANEIKNMKKGGGKVEY